MNRTGLAAVMLLAVALAGCGGGTSVGGNEGEPVVVGGFLGNAFRDGSIGQSEADSALADLLKTKPGSSLDAKDRQAAAMALLRALDQRTTGAAITWRNRSSGASGSVIAGPIYQVNNVICRDYTHVLKSGEAQEQVRGSACREQDGSWRPIV